MCFKIAALLTAFMQQLGVFSVSTLPHKACVISELFPESPVTFEPQGQFRSQG